MKKGAKATIIIVILILTFVIIYESNKKPAEIDEELAKCIGSKSVLYTKTGCPACKKQEDIFGENYKYLNNINCLIEIEKCLYANVEYIPTWIINNNKYVGVQTIDKLKGLTGC